jgi:hypothetical protein
MQQPTYGEEYLCYLSNDYIGSGTFTSDPYVGDCFVMWEVHKNRGIREIILMPDNWIPETEEDC